MSKESAEPFGLVVEGAYRTQAEAERALIHPFLEDWVEENGRFRLHQMDSIAVVPGVMLGQLQIEPVGEHLFLISSKDPKRPLTGRKVHALAEALRRQDMFESIQVEPLTEDEEL